MKITRLTTHWEVEQLIDFLDMLDEIRESLVNPKILSNPYRATTASISNSNLKI